MYRLKKYEYLSMVIFILGSLLYFELGRSIGATELIPVDLNLLRGDTARFYFKIFATDSAVDQKCSYSITGIDPLVASFDEKSTIVNAESSKDVYGTISVPTDAEIKSYTGSLAISCEPSIGVEGTSGSVVKYVVKSGFVIRVVSQVEQRAVAPVPTPPPTTGITTSTILIIVVLTIVIIGTGYWVQKKVKKPKV